MNDDDDNESDNIGWNQYDDDDDDDDADDGDKTAFRLHIQVHQFGDVGTFGMIVIT